MMEFLIASFAALCSGVLGALGVGGGAVLLLYLTLLRDIPQLTAQAINLIFFIPVAAAATVLHAKNKLIDFKVAAVCIVTGCAGVMLGVYITTLIDQAMLGKLFAVLLLFMGFKELFSGKRPNSPHDK